jgi:hypothetical protein
MASTYSPSLRIQLIETGTENEAWGQPLDNNLGTIIEQAITGVNSISLTNLTSYTLTTANASPDQARNAVLVFTGALSANCDVVAPAAKKVYVVSNQTTGGYNISVTVGSGTNVAVANGTNQLVYCNGTSFRSAVDVNSIIGNLDVSGSSSVGGNVTVSGGTVFGSGNITTTNGNLTLRSTTSNVVNFQGSTGALIPPFGATSQRPASPQVGMSRWNTDLGWYEIWNGIIWQQITGSYSVSYLIVAGGGGGGAAQFGSGGGGGAGGLLTGAYLVNPLTSYSITIGGGGAGWGFPGGVNTGTGTNGANTTALGFIAISGGGGGFNGANGLSGGSGGGMGGSSTSGQGFAGGNSGGGGAGQVGGNSSGVGPTAGNGGNGIQTSITGTATYYAGGGAGGLGNQNPGYDPVAGGLGGGGASAVAGSGNGTNGLGGGGSGASQSGSSQTAAGNGGSGVVILSYANLTQRATGGTVTSYTSGGTTYWVHTFTTSGTFTTS